MVKFKMMNTLKINPSENCEAIVILLTKVSYPIAYNNKIEELVEQKLYPSKEAAEKDNPEFELDCEIYYHKHLGVFAVEQGAVESSIIYSPYNCQRLLEDEE